MLSTTLTAIAFIAAHLHEKGKHNVNFTYAFHRAELVGAFFNGVFLLALALSILLQSIERFVNVEPVESPIQILIVGSVGLFLNIISALVIHGMTPWFYFYSQYIDAGIADHGGHSHGNDAIALAISDDSDSVNRPRDSIVRWHSVLVACCL
ncbi:hypothetical protein DXG03_007800 [Asterophora parasitica]|uniref:Cation efflux protein transmembrane domain-containing protein n=1 Tax=Asterophora parasitica TaxID=117018 RepID=A0A9P7KDD1_9AGAR|nr:hypothetical protein DXG03_007800 [Asterophora parasitica]